MTSLLMKSIKKDNPKEETKRSETKRTDKDSYRKIQTFNSEAVDECCFSDDDSLSELN